MKNKIKDECEINRKKKNIIYININVYKKGLKSFLED
jgi:hypothetical protein